MASEVSSYVFCSLASRDTASDPLTMTGFRSMARSMAAQNFTMPAMSPTMTEGNIAKWNVKEGMELLWFHSKITYRGISVTDIHVYR